MVTRGLTAIGCVALLSGCAGVSGGASAPIAAMPPLGGMDQQKIRHIVIIVQENRSFDDLFGGPEATIPGIDAVAYGRVLGGTPRLLTPASLADDPDPDHDHYDPPHDRCGVGGWAEYNDFGRYDAYIPANCGARNPALSYSYVRERERRPYVEMAKRYTVADRFFTANSGPSWPAHQYLIAGHDDEIADLPKGALEWEGCSNRKGENETRRLSPAGVEGPTDAEPPCFGHLSLGSLVDAQNLTWRMYGPRETSPGNAFDSIKRESHKYARDDWDRHVSWPMTNVALDANPAAGGLSGIAPVLANLTWVVSSDSVPGFTFQGQVTPVCGYHAGNYTNMSDHPGAGAGCYGPSYVEHLVNAIGTSPFWNSTAILILWDDSGGFYDHVPPFTRWMNLSGKLVPDRMGPGNRTGLIVISPYAKNHYVSHVTYDFGSVLRFVEKHLGLGTLNPRNDYDGAIDNYVYSENAGYPFAGFEPPPKPYTQPSARTALHPINDLDDCFDFEKQPAQFQEFPTPGDGVTDSQADFYTAARAAKAAASPPQI
jgi:phospholipase C